MMKPTTILLQNVDTAETRSISKACYLEDITKFRADVNDLSNFKDLLMTGNCLPVGSVEFVKQAMHQAEISVPKNFGYHESIAKFANRKIELSTAGEALAISRQSPTFVKPVETKLFTGFVLGPQTDTTEDEHVSQCLKDLVNLSSDEPVWISSVVDFVCEYRYYFKGTRLLGTSRYDDGEDHDIAPTFAIVQEAARNLYNQLQIQSFCLDFGVNSKGETLLVEANDAWAIGLYNVALNGPQYLDFLYSRWCQIFSDSKVNQHA